MSDSALVKNKEASINTTGINIKCLRVDGRNLTMSVFRQIPKENPIDKETHELIGNVWGWVNYFWKNNKGDIHLIWQHDGSLYRYPKYIKVHNGDELNSYFWEYFERDYRYNGTKGYWKYNNFPTEKIESKVNKVRDEIRLVSSEDEKYKNMKLNTDQSYDIIDEYLIESDLLNNCWEVHVEYYQLIVNMASKDQLYIAT